MRDLYKVQGHSFSGTTEWDWSKYEAQPGLGGADNAAGDAVNSGGRDNILTTAKAVEIKQGPPLWQAIPAEAKVATRMNVRRICSTRYTRELRVLLRITQHLDALEGNC